MSHYSSTTRCARCKGMFYCSRQCQKEEWPAHKPFCHDAEKHSDFTRKCLQRLNDSQEFRDSLRVALAEKYYKVFTTSPNPTKMWVVATYVGLRPRDGQDFKALGSPKVPIASLLKKKMPGELIIYKMTDLSNMENHPINDRARAMWRQSRDRLDNTGFTDSHAILVLFVYNDEIQYLLLEVVSPQDLQDVQTRADASGDWRQMDLPNPGIERVNHFLTTGELSKKFRSPMSDGDKKSVREAAREVLFPGQWTDL
ncbi:hypothetical protein GALMADRAFT_147232 [Galerina marginata CBS 339.88]|uniref:MYND-type domain-containing protein n=1 Tax=Galerina marginata (strain CBS 339.88) TaxID=685588 RepID=A0A067S8M3_GALM3|nr:hypothetical protein GALMADRAFT_147232 [Galerina marginata CBS 339.88]